MENVSSNKLQAVISELRECLLGQPAEQHEIRKRDDLVEEARATIKLIPAGLPMAALNGLCGAGRELYNATVEAFKPDNPSAHCKASIHQIAVDLLSMMPTRERTADDRRTMVTAYKSAAQAWQEDRNFHLSQRCWDKLLHELDQITPSEDRDAEQRFEAGQPTALVKSKSLRLCAWCRHCTS